MHDIDKNEQIITHISQLKGYEILEIINFKPNVKKIFCKESINGFEKLHIFFCNTEVIMK